MGLSHAVLGRLEVPNGQIQDGVQEKVRELGRLAGSRNREKGKYLSRFCFCVQGVPLNFILCRRIYYLLNSGKIKNKNKNRNSLGKTEINKINSNGINFKKLNFTMNPVFYLLAVARRFFLALVSICC